MNSHSHAAILPAPRSPLDRARRKAYLRLMPLLVLCYVIAYVNRQNVSFAALEMTKSLAGFDSAVIGLGSGIFFIGYFALEIPGTLMVERWSARKLICRIMVTWGIMAALTAAVRTPLQFYVVRFLLGVAEAGFFPGVIVFLTHWFSGRDRTRALAWFLIGSPIAGVVTPRTVNFLLKIGTDEKVNGVLVHHPRVLGMLGWQWVYVAWGLPAVLMGAIVFFGLTDRPRDATWLTAEEREALERELQADHDRSFAGRHMTLVEALRHPKVLLLALAYFFIVTGNYGIEFFLPSILDQWYNLKLDRLTWLMILPPLLAVIGQLAAGWSSDRTRERRMHAVVPIAVGAVILLAAPWTKGNLVLTMICFILAYTATKAYLPGFWALPSLFLTPTAAAASIGLINSIGNLGGFAGPYVLGAVQKRTNSYVGGIYFLCVSMAAAATILLLVGVGRREPKEPVAAS